MPPRYSYWTIVAGGLPTAFRAAERDELLPTFKRIQEKHPDAEMKYFARGKLWASQDEARQAAEARRAVDRRPESRGRDWRPGGEHVDPRQKFKDAKKDRNLEWRKQRFERRQPSATAARPPSATPPPTGTRPPATNRPAERQARPDWRDRPPRADKPQGTRQDRPPHAGKPQGTWQDRPPRAGKPQGTWQDRPPRAGKPQGTWQDRPPRAGKPQGTWQDRPPRAGKPQGSGRDRPPRAGKPQGSGRTARRAPASRKARGKTGRRAPASRKARGRTARRAPASRRGSGRTARRAPASRQGSGRTAPRAPPNLRDRGKAVRRAKSLMATRSVVQLVRLPGSVSSETRAPKNRRPRRRRKVRIVSRSPTKYRNLRRRHGRLNRRSGLPGRRREAAAVEGPSKTVADAHDCPRRAVPPTSRSVTRCAQLAGRGVRGGPARDPLRPPSPGRAARAPRARLRSVDAGGLSVRRDPRVR